MMEKGRTNKVNIIIGGRDVGKTTYAKTYFDLYPKILVMDQIDHPKYRDLEEISLEQLPRWIKGKKRIFRPDSEDIFESVSQYVNNSFIVIEDSSKFIDFGEKKVKAIIKDTKQHNNDVFMMFHMFSEIPRYVYGLANYLTVFYTNEEVNTSLKYRIPDYYRVKAASDKVRAIARQGRKRGKKDRRRYYNITIEIGA